MRLSYLFETTILEYTPEQEAEQAKWRRKSVFPVKFPGRAKPEKPPEQLSPECPICTGTSTKVSQQEFSDHFFGRCKGGSPPSAPEKPLEKLGMSDDIEF